MENVIKQRVTKSGGAIVMAKADHLYIVRCANKLGKVTSWRYAGKSLKKAEEHYKKQN